MLQETSKEWKSVYVKKGIPIIIEYRKKRLKENHRKRTYTFSMGCVVRGRTMKKVKKDITMDDLIFLKKNTRYDEEELRDWFRCGYL